MSQSLEKMLRHAKSLLEASVESPPAERACQYRDFLKIENRRLFSLHRAGASGLEVARGRSLMMDTLLHYIFRSAIRSTTSHSNSKSGAPRAGARGTFGFGETSPKLQSSSAKASEDTRPPSGDTHSSTGGSPWPPAKAGEKTPLEMCLVATGGYGRGELNPFSDVDILFLLPNARGPHLPRINATVEQVLYILWDLGLKVGHATRTIPECLEQANKDMQSRTALAEARLLQGSKTVFSTFETSLYKKCIQGHLKSYIDHRLKDLAQRHSKYGDTVFVQEPNVKNGCGGLRDLQSLLWIVRFKNNIKTQNELYRSGLLGQIETGRLSRAYDYLMRVRNELHYANQRAVDEITLSAQAKIAEALGYHQKDILKRIETFMRDYYRHARDIYVLTRTFAERLTIEDVREQKLSRLTSVLPFGKKKEKREGGLILKNEMIECPEDASFPSNAQDMMQAFRTAQLRRARIGPHLQSGIRQHLKLINREFMYSKRARDLFFAILKSKGEVGRILRVMHECGFLDEYIPEFGALDCLVQHEFYHRYTADEHTLVAIEKLDEILNATHGPASYYQRIFQQLEHSHLLYLAILLHDTGKALRVRHHNDASTECAQKVARRFCLNPEVRRTLLWLVDHHMTMSSLIQRRDIEDPSTIEDFCKIVETRERLDMLYLLTFVDGQAVGSTTWNEWRQSLLHQFYHLTAKAIDVSDVEHINIETQREQLRSTIRPKLPTTITEDEMEAHFTQMPSRYWQRVDSEELPWHLKTIHAFFENLLDDIHGSSPVIQWRHFPDRGYSEAIICSWDRHGLFAKIAGAFAATRINILNADIYTRSDNLVLDIFQVCDLEHRAIQNENQMEKMLRILTESLYQEEPFPFTDIIRKEYENMRHIPNQGEERFPTTVIFDNEDSTDYTILEIQTPDRLGLLYHILQVITECDLDIDLAKINTEAGAAMDVFYLTNSQGEKLTDSLQLESIQKKLKETIDDLNKPYRKMMPLVGH